MFHNIARLDGKDCDPSLSVGGSAEASASFVDSGVLHAEINVQKGFML